MRSGYGEGSGCGLHVLECFECRCFLLVHTASSSMHGRWQCDCGRRRVWKDFDGVWRPALSLWLQAQQYLGPLMRQWKGSLPELILKACSDEHDWLRLHHVHNKFRGIDYLWNKTLGSSVAVYISIPFCVCQTSLCQVLLLYILGLSSSGGKTSSI